MFWISFFIFIQMLHAICTWKLYVLAARKAWEALIPIYNLIVLLKIIQRPWWWLFLFFIPIINLLMFPSLWVETIRTFGKTSRKDAFIVLITLGLYLGYISYFDKNLQYNTERITLKKSALGEWVNSLLFAVIAATLVHTYFIQPFVIPTSSLEKTLLVGDFLLVSKFHYGARTPITTLAAPMVHDTLPLINKKSYLDWIQLPYFRFPGFQKVKKNDIIVYNWPADTVQQFYNSPDRIIKKPIDKKSNYVKRCVATPGDTLEIKKGVVFINNKRLLLSGRAKPQYSYIVKTKRSFGPKHLFKKYNITDDYGVYQKGRIYFFKGLTEEAALKFAKDPMVISVTKNLAEVGKFDKSTFPHKKQFPWNHDNFGPLYIPKKGVTITINRNNLPLYKRIIEVYENNEVSIKEGHLFINNKKVDQYTFKQNYYWGMGDNRHNSEDCRNWGYIPEDHILGKPVFIWFSWEQKATGILNKIRWNRLFTTVGGNDTPTSYFGYFFITLIAYYIYRRWRNKKSPK